MAYQNEELRHLGLHNAESVGTGTIVEVPSMATVTATQRQVRRRRHRTRHVNAYFRWKRNRHLLPLMVGAVLLALLTSVILGLGWWYSP